MIYFVTGASRGIGLEFVRQLSERKDCRVYAACRDTSSRALQTIASQRPSVIVVELDITRPESVQGLISLVRTMEGPIDVLINNAGISLPNHPTDDFPSEANSEVHCQHAGHCYVQTNI
jgi:NAD(P)-dependent dehydrogenase (short-subunit alcohol dehydrogenase family)